MTKKIVVLIGILIIQTDCMDLPINQNDFFSQQSNVIRRHFIFPLIHSCQNLKQVHNIIVPIALISKRSYAQMMDHSFLKDMLKQLKNIYMESDAHIIQKLRIPAINNYEEPHKKLFRLGIKNNFSAATIPYFRFYIKMKKIDPNFSIGKEGITFLMFAVYNNSPELTKFLVTNGAHYNACTHHEESSAEGYLVRDFNIIYRTKIIKKHLNSLTSCLFPNTQRNSLFFFDTNISQKSVDQQFNAMRDIYFAKFFYINKSYKNFCMYKKDISDEICNALYIDSMLEKKGASSSFQQKNHPLLQLLINGHKQKPGIAYVMALSCIFNNNIEKIKMDAPSLLAHILCSFIEPKKKGISV